MITGTPNANPRFGFLYRLGTSGIFLFTTLLRAILPPYKLYPLIKQIHFIGARSLLVILVSGAFVGMVVALQFHDTLVRFGSVSLLGSAVGLSLIRELGPVLTALMVIGRAGSAICAEISIMRNEQQIDALQCMAIDPYEAHRVVGRNSVEKYVSRKSRYKPIILIPSTATNPLSGLGFLHQVCDKPDNLFRGTRSNKLECHQARSEAEEMSMCINEAGIHCLSLQIEDVS